MNNYQYPEGTTAADIDALCNPPRVDRGCTTLIPGKSVIHAERICPPVPSRKFDWQAAVDGWDLGDPVGYGETKEAAIADLKQYLADSAWKLCTHGECAKDTTFSCIVCGKPVCPNHWLEHKKTHES